MVGSVFRSIFKASLPPDHRVRAFFFSLSCFCFARSCVASKPRSHPPVVVSVFQEVSTLSRSSTDCAVWDERGL